MARPERRELASSRSELDCRCPMPLHGDCRPQCDLETDCVQTMCDRKGTAGSSATEDISDARGPSRGGREQGRSVGAGACTRERSCLATLYTVTSISASSNRSTGDCAIQKTHSGDTNALNLISAQHVDPPEEFPALNAEAQVDMLCAATSPSACGPWPGQTCGGYECSSRVQEFDYYVDSIMDGLTVESPIMIPHDEPSDAHAEFVEDKDEGKELLRAFMRARSRTELPQGLIIDSTHPELAPHIVITPPADHPYESYCSCGNCDRDWPYTPPQYTDSLVVPPPQQPLTIYEGLDVLHEQIEEPVSNILPQTDHDSKPIDANEGEVPYRVFSHSLFAYSVESAAEERLAFYHVIPAIHKRSFRLAALAASEAAPVFRERWDSEEFCAFMERPFTWTDPAEPLLTEFAHQPHTMILDSSDSFIAPHIVISEAPVQNPWELDAIYAPPQNCYYGHLLTHPSYGCVGLCCLSRYYPWLAAPLQEFLPPVDEDASAEAAEEVTEEPETLEDADALEDPFEGEDESDDLGSDSDASTDAPQTPQDGVFTGLAAPPVLLGKDTSLSPAATVCFHIDEDDEDLPPFDDWYRDIAQRAC